MFIYRCHCLLSKDHERGPREGQVCFEATSHDEAMRFFYSMFPEWKLTDIEFVDRVTAPTEFSFGAAFLVLGGCMLFWLFVAAVYFGFTIAGHWASCAV